MAYVTVPKDLTKVKNKVAFNLTKRQLICFGVGALIGFPFYFLTKGVLGNTNAATGMVLLMVAFDDEATDMVKGSGTGFGKKTASVVLTSVSHTVHKKIDLQERQH